MSSPSHRLFTAIPIEIGSSLRAALKRTRVNADKREMEVNWIPESNFHVTLNFLGPTEHCRLPHLLEVLAAVSSSHPPLETSLRGMGGFPDDHHMRTLWIGVRKSRALAALQEDLRSRLVAAGFPQEEREYHPHLTVGKLRKARSGSDLFSPYVRTSFGDVAVSSIDLFESVTAGSHPVYKIMNRLSLTGSLAPDPIAN